MADAVVRAAAIQINSSENIDDNLATADRLVRDAASRGAELVVLPEKWNVLGRAEAMAAAAEPIGGPVSDWGHALAAELGIDLIAGSIRRVAARPVEDIEHEPPPQPGRPASRRLPEAPHVRCRDRRDGVCGVRARAAG